MRINEDQQKAPMRPYFRFLLSKFLLLFCFEPFLASRIPLGV
jgi:hypothetical protein